jgi:SAM-dependent methyltransferase
MPFVHGHIDVPAPGEVCDPLCFRLEGWINAGAAQGDVVAIEAWAGGQCAGATALLFDRPDVTAAFGLPAGTRTGFRLVGHLAAPPTEGRLELRVRHRDNAAPLVAAAVEVRFSTRDYRRVHYGVLLDSRSVGIAQRDHIYTSGPSLSEGSREVVHLLRDYLPPPPCRVIDVGCGLGWYGWQLRSLGYDWLGAEVKAGDCAELSRLGLPHRQVDGRTLPFADGEFDAALCVEVLEHIAEPRTFLAEVRRVAPRRLLVSVPNAELIAYLGPHLAVPWHLLEADHKNFFTRWSLGALLREFYPTVEIHLHTRHPLPTVEGAPLFYNLFAVAWTP